MHSHLDMPRLNDEYPTRHHGPTQWIPRQEPVVHHALGTQAPGPLSSEQLARFERDGFLFLPSLFSAAEVQSFRDELRALAQEYAGSESPEAILEPDSGALRSLFRIHQNSVVFGRLAGDVRLADAARQILGDEVGIHQSRVNRKPGFRGKEFAWHSDFETWHAEDGMPRMRAVSASVTLDDNLPVNGSLMLIPGSHTTFVSCPGFTPEDNYRQSLRAQATGVPAESSIAKLVDLGGGITMPTGPAGSLLLFDCNVLHGSSGNMTPYPRSNAFFVYNALSNVLEDPFCGNAPRPSFLADRNPRPVKGLPVEP